MVAVPTKKQKWPALPYGVRWALIVAVAAATIGFRPQQSPAQPPDPHTGEKVVEAAGEDFVHLYFTDRSARFLSGERRMLPPTSDAPERIRQIVEALVRGPAGSLLPSVPKAAALRAAFLLEGRTAVVDLDGSIRTAHSGGVHAERLTVYAVVNSITLNMGSVETVRILIDGKEEATLAGHWDIRTPLTADLLLIR